MTTETALIHGGSGDGSALPPDDSGLRPVSYPPSDDVSATPRRSPSSGSRPPASTGADELADPMVTATPRQPRRYLDPDLAQAIKEAKLKTEASWRRVAKCTGLSHSYLVQLSNGQRVPSRETVEVLVAWLPLEEWAVEELRAVAINK